MNAHFIISIVKSVFRFVGSASAVIFAFINIPIALIILACNFGVAEILGVLEEIFDSRK